jgi:hypothetical protein
MLGESHLNVLIVGADLPSRQRERIQAQVQTALRSLPMWAFDLLRGRIAELGVRNLPLIIEPRARANGGAQVLSFGRIEGRPAVRLMPRLEGEAVDWGQDQRYLLAKAVAFMAAPLEDEQGEFWLRWRQAVALDRLPEKAREAGEHWEDAGDLALLVEMFAAFAVDPAHRRWGEFPEVRAFLESWRGSQ